jgi:spermidine/putrescine transport system substrate-binding protein
MATNLRPGYLSRRELLRRGVVVVTIGAGAPQLLAACGGDDAGGTSAATGGGDTGGTPAVPQASGAIDFLSWEGYDLPNAMKAWKKEHGVTVNPTYIGNHNDIQARLKGAGGSSGFDLITYYQGYRPLYDALEILEPLDPDKLPNLAGMIPFFGGENKNFWIGTDGTRTGVPWTWGGMGITYDTAVEEEPTTYDVLLEPRLKGKVITVDDTIGNFTQAAHVLGFDVARMTEDQFSQVQDYLRQIIAQTKGIAPSYGDYTTRLVAGDATMGFNGWAAVDQFARDAGKDTIKTVLPKEGGMSFCDAYAIPPGADNVDTAHAWINEAISPEVNAAANAELIAGVTVTGAIDLLPKNIRSLYPYDDLDSFLAQAPLYNNPPNESDEFVTIDRVLSAWQELKAG